MCVSVRNRNNIERFFRTGLGDATHEMDFTHYAMAKALYPKGGLESLNPDVKWTKGELHVLYTRWINKNEQWRRSNFLERTRLKLRSWFKSFKKGWKGMWFF